MNVPNISQGPGSAATLSRSGTDAGVLSPARAEAPTASPRVQALAPGISLTRLACFDVNGDGQIDPRSAASGGDATLLVPSHFVDLPTWTHAVSPGEAPHPIRTKEAASGNAARTNRAVDAYQRYGQTPSAPTPPPAPPTPVAQPAPPPRPVPLPNPVAADVTAALSTGAATGR